MKIFRDKELEARLDRLEKMVEKLTKKKDKSKTSSEIERIQKIEDSFQKLFNYNEDIAVKGYRK